MGNRLRDTNELKVENRGGCGADTYGADDLIPDDISDSAYILENGEEKNFPENPKDSIPDPKETGIVEASVYEIAEYLEEVMDEFRIG